jgi:hypothetical protein
VQIQPGVFFTFEAPMLRIIALYSNVLEDPGVIASDDLGDSQLEYLKAALHRVDADKFNGALIIAHHHPAFTVGSKHGWSEAMRKQIDAKCAEANVWPHAVLSAHAHNYQRFTRVHEAMEIPYIVAGNGGHNIARLKRAKDAGGRPTHSASRSRTDSATRYESPYRAPTVLQEAHGEDDLVRLENYDDQDYGYLRVVVTSEQLRIEYHPASDTGEAKTPDDICRGRSQDPQARRGEALRSSPGAYPQNLTASPVAGAVSSPSHITRRPRTMVPTGQPVTVLSS